MELKDLLDLHEKLEMRINAYWTYWSVAILALGGWLFTSGKTLTGPERVRLFKLAFDASISGFSGRQSLYEYFFFGDPVRMAQAVVGSYDRSPYTERVRAFLDEDGPIATR